MNQSSVTFGTDIDLTVERLEEIFAVPETKQLIDEFMKKEENNETLKNMVERYDLCFKIPELLGIEVKSPDTKEFVWWNIEIAIIAEALQLVVSGLYLDQAIQQILKEQLEDPKILQYVEESIVIN